MLKQKKKPLNFCAGITDVGKIVKLLCSINLLMLLCGCAVTDNGTTHHFIFGFGVVSVNNAHTNIAIVQKATAFGIYGGTGPGGKIGVGYMNRQTIEVVTNSNLIISVDSKPGKQVIISIPCAQHLQ
jgi:hypothetical protein